MIKGLCIFALFALFLSVTLADLPVHCEFPQVKGKWVFTMTAKKFDKSVVYDKCSLDAKLDRSDLNETRVISLESPNIARWGDFVGTWTLIYDQGFEIRINNENIFAYFYYEKIGETVISHCDTTFMGVFYDNKMLAQKWGCLKAQKQGPTILPAATSEPAKPSCKTLGHNHSKKFKSNEKLINYINSIEGNTWKAAKYDFFEQMSEEEVVKLAGKPLSQRQIESKRNHKKLMSQFQPKMTASNLKLPANFDWRNVAGMNYVSPVRNQLHCGSCYAFGACASLEARVRILTGNTQTPVYSPQHVVDCTPFSQGCEGGFSYLVYKYGSQWGMVSEQAAPYNGTELHTCKQDKYPLSQRLLIKDYQYVGGYYGATTEENMMEEIFANGPVTVSFEVLPDFRYYRSGVYRHVEVPHEILKEDPHFVITNHLVLAVGWGVTQDGVKYWICKNSWSDTWGMQGYFWIERGVDMVGIESEVVSVKLAI